MIEAKREKIGRALLFDIDGTLADTDPLHREAFHRVFAPRGHVVDDERFKRELQGFSNVSIGERFLPDESPERRLAILDEKETIFRDLVAGQIVPLQGLMALLDRADSAGIPMVAVTNAPRLNAELLLSGLGITHRFKALVIGAELPHGKPHPLPYQEGLRFVGASAQASIAFEDSRTGIESATAAGIPTIGMRTTLSHADLVAAGAVASASAYDDPDLLARLAAAMTW
ncbi:HAD family hydrolase [Bradyrhizobium sp. CCBAU 45389]|uniref:HAD family hydrolase n=1 Tax=Bradyrhizobium sp. CCBAU 45389 TaxID=858429 RepID=UPI002306C444|nr:HAD-IA family hydrolase [Bradyrhizobium sp. CCBAU 45389]MDA9398194.1 haloacid dehalogenase [Bradyrhizobium sp. CCBAU 45389]